jgi:MFS family permease
MNLPMSANPNTGIDSPRAWLNVLAAFFGAFVAFGVTYTFGVFLKPIGATFGASHAAMSAIFSTMTVLSFFLAPITGDLADRIGPRCVVGVGALLMGAGLLLTARVHSFPMLFVTYGMCVGASVACIYIPSVAAVGEWFKVHRDIALGIAISGIGCGTLVAAPLAAHLTVRYGWRTAFEIFGWTSTAIVLGCAALLSRPPILRAKDTANVPAMMRTRTFALLYVTLVFSGIAIYITFVFLPAFAADIGASHVAGAALIGYVGASSVVGRLGLNALAPRFGLLNVYKICYWILLGGCVIWLMSHTYPVLVLFALVMGVGYGGIAAMTPAVAAARFGIEGLGELLGFLFTAFGVACLVGPPLAGILADYTHDYKWPVFIAAAAAILALFAVLPLRDSAPDTTVNPEAATAD